jgi:hypothetical protein
MGFNENKDIRSMMVNLIYLEVAKHGVDADIKA